MKRTLLLIFLLVLSGSYAMAATTPCTDSNVQWIGRWPDRTVNSKATKTAINGGQRFRVGFSGTSLSLNIVVASPVDATGYPYIVYSVDGGAWTTKLCNTSSVSIASGLAAGSHTLDCYVKGVGYDNSKWTTASGLNIQDFVTDAGSSLSPFPTGNSKRMLVIGDSIGEGTSMYGDGSSNGGLNTSDMDGRQSWPNQLGRMIGADTWVHAFAGASFHGYQGNIPPTATNYLYKMSGIGKADPSFDIVIIESVNNDGDGNGVTSTDFRNWYTSLINQLKTDQPGAALYCCTPVSPWAPTRKADVIYVANATGCTVVNLTDLAPSGGSWGANNGHPDVTHATQIANYVYTLLPPPPGTARSTAQRMMSFR